MIVRRRKHKRSRLNRSRGRHGQLVKARHHRRRRHRRSNPGLIVANPRRRRRRRSPMVVTQPTRRRRRGLRRRGALHYRRRRSNPSFGRLRSYGSILRVGIFGGLGIITARVGAYLYSTYAASYVIGTETDATGWRHTLNEVLRLLAMGVVTVGVEKGLSASRLMRRPEDRNAFYYGGMGEMGRQAIGLVVKKLSPDTTLDKYGLGEYSQFQVDQAGNVYGLADDGQWYLVGQQGMAGLMPAEGDNGFNGLVNQQEYFGNVVYAKRFPGETSEDRR